MGIGLIDSLIENTVGKVTDKLLDFIPDPVQKAQFLVQMRTMDWNEIKAQLDVDALEAQSGKWFEADWRPFIGWVCGVAFLYKFIILPFTVFIALAFDPQFPVKSLPTLDWTELSTVLFGMLGLSYHRTQEKTAIATGKGG